MELAEGSTAVGCVVSVGLACGAAIIARAWSGTNEAIDGVALAEGAIPELAVLSAGWLGRVRGASCVGAWSAIHSRAKVDSGRDSGA